MSEPTKQEYPVATIFDMARIPEDRLPAFMEELPEMLRVIRWAEERTEARRRTLPRWLRPMIRLGGKMIWVDEGARRARVQFDERRVGGPCETFATDDWRKEAVHD